VWQATEVNLLAAVQNRLLDAFIIDAHTLSPEMLDKIETTRKGRDWVSRI
jgi:hypothetical protein